MPYHLIYDRIQKVLDSCKNKYQLDVAEEYCYKLVKKKLKFNKRYFFSPSKVISQRLELQDFIRGRSWKIRKFLH